MTTENSNNQNQHTIDDAFVAEVYEQMVKFATSQLQDADKAQDMVQDAMVSALQYADSFHGQSTLKTWIFAILKNKIIDELRHKKRHVNIADLKSRSDESASSDEDFLQLLFDESGFWHKYSKPKAFDSSWTDPSQQVEEEGFFAVMETCLSDLPAEQARVFLMREYIELDTTEICETVGITSSKFYVLMHRTRLRLQQCLTIRWFEAV